MNSLDNYPRRVDVEAWNHYIDGPQSKVPNRFDQFVGRHLFPLAEAVAAALGFRVPVPWEPTSRIHYVRYWRLYATWKIVRAYARRPLMPPLGFFAWYMYPPTFGCVMGGHYVRRWDGLPGLGEAPASTSTLSPSPRNPRTDPMPQATHQTLVEAAKAAVEKVAADRTVSQHRVIESLRDLRDDTESLIFNLQVSYSEPRKRLS